MMHDPEKSDPSTVAAKPANAPVGAGGERWRRRGATGDLIIVRCADDIVVGFRHRHEAERFLGELARRLAEFALQLQPDKTRLIEFGRHAASNRRGRGLGKPETFDFPGFAHICGRSRKGRFQLRRRSRRDRMRTKLREIKEVLRRRRHEPIADQGRWLGQVVRGWFNYHAVPTNAFALRSFRAAAVWLWRQALRRRGDRKRISWQRFGRLADRWVPKPRILHPWPSQRFAVTHPRWEPDALIGHVRFCAGGVQ